MLLALVRYALDVKSNTSDRTSEIDSIVVNCERDGMMLYDCRRWVSCPGCSQARTHHSILARPSKCMYQLRFLKL